MYRACDYPGRSHRYRQKQVVPATASGAGRPTLKHFQTEIRKSRAGTVIHRRTSFYLIATWVTWAGRRYGPDRFPWYQLISGRHRPAHGQAHGAWPSVVSTGSSSMNKAGRAFRACSVARAGW